MNQTEVIPLITAAISNIGFPIVLTGYLLLRLEKKMEALNNTILELLHVLREEVRK